ncbi:MAG: SMP-30/gluconolactonase/LRE family protein, partial [Bacteroidia bacterium]|nr:SMP-30/gluconolactonase/LRE family protein [Bacteroidia bacterium]
MSSQENYVIYDLLPEGTFTKGMEGPAVDSEGNLYAVNFGEQGTIGKVTPDGVANLFITLPEGSIGNGIRFDRAGSMYIADYTGHNILRIKKETLVVIEVYAHCSDMNQPNDLTVSPVSQVIYASDPNWRDSTGNLWMIPAPDSVVLVEEGIGTTNGIEVSPDGKTLYVNESIQRKIWRYDIGADNMPVNKKEFYSFEDFGMDGMRCDNDGNLFVTRHGKGTVVKLSPKGELLHEYQLKGKLPTNLTFSNDFKKIFVTLADRGCFEVIDFTPAVNKKSNAYEVKI